MENSTQILGISLLVFIPIYFLFVWRKGLLTLSRFTLLVALEVGVASTYIPGRKGEWIGSAAGALLLCRYLMPHILKWRKNANGRRRIREK
jgi:hypothetical protein